MTRLVILSDSHLSHSKDYFPNETFPSVPDGDILIHCGDGTFRGTRDEMYIWLKWFAKFPHKNKLCIVGNHELGMERAPEIRQWTLEFMAANFITYLEDSEVVINGLKFYGSPHTSKFYDWAYMHEGARIKPFWDTIPSDTDVLITHGPPYGIMDLVTRNRPGRPEEAKAYLTHVGCTYLREAIRNKAILVHAYGHIHSSHGTEKIDETLFINAAIVNEEYKVEYNPVVVDIDENKIVTLIS